MKRFTVRVAAAIFRVVVPHPRLINPSSPMHWYSKGIVASVIAATFVASSALPAQLLRIKAGLAKTSHSELSPRLAGGGIEVSWPLGTSGLRFHLGGEHYSVSANDFGVVCAGLIEPGTCAREPLRTQGSMSVLAAGVDYPVVKLPRFRTSIVSEVNVNRVSVTKTGFTSKSSLSSSDPVWGGSVGGAASFMPVRQLPLLLEAGATVGAVRSIASAQMVDGYEPFRGGAFRVGRAWVGISFGRAAWM